MWFREFPKGPCAPNAHTLALKYLCRDGGGRDDDDDDAVDEEQWEYILFSDRHIATAATVVLVAASNVSAPVARGLGYRAQHLAWVLNDSWVSGTPSFRGLHPSPDLQPNTIEQSEI